MDKKPRIRSPREYGRAGWSGIWIHKHLRTNVPVFSLAPRFFGDLARLADPSAFAAWRAEQAREAWCVYSKPPVNGPEVVLKYLARYVDHVAISNQRLVSLEDGQVTFRYKDYRQSGRHRQKTITLPAEEFLRRFLMHVLPAGLQKVRSYG